MQAQVQVGAVHHVPKLKLHPHRRSHVDVRQVVLVVGNKLHPVYPHEVVTGGFFGRIPLPTQAGAGHFAQIRGNDLVGFALLNKLPFLEIERFVAKCLHSGQVMAHKQNRAPAGRIIAHFAKALFLKFGIAHGQYLIHDHDFGVEVRGDGEA